MDFLFWFFLAGIIIASLQDLKRREVDDWLNLFLLVGGLVFIFFKGFMQGNNEIIFLGVFSVVLMFVISHLFYYGRVFAGGDAKLLFAMSAFFVGISFLSTIANILIFLASLMVAGSVYGIFYSLFLYGVNRKEVNQKILKNKNLSWVKYVCLLGVVFLVVSFFEIVFLIFAVLFIVSPFLYIFAKGLEEVVMVRSVLGKNLREGDWLAKDIRVKGKMIKSSWDGLTKEDLKLLKARERVLIKEGIPFVPAFLIAYILYFLFRANVLEFLVGIF